jgi:hypothetical protein
VSGRITRKVLMGGGYDVSADGRVNSIEADDLAATSDPVIGTA